MDKLRSQMRAMNGYVCRAEAPVTRPATDYTARFMPHRIWGSGLLWNTATSFNNGDRFQHLIYASHRE